MELSNEARDILRLLPADAVLYEDSSSQISVRLQETDVLTSPAMAAIYDTIDGEVSSSIDFRTRMVCITFDARPPVLSSSPRASGLVSCTVGEQHAVDMANRMGAIDYDNLVPSWTMTTTGGDTTLVLGRLLRISHDALLRQLSPRCTRVEYRMHDQTTALYFAAEKKRKMI